jgi:hypothetical protein
MCFYSGALARIQDAFNAPVGLGGFQMSQVLLRLLWMLLLPLGTLWSTAISVEEPTALAHSTSAPSAGATSEMWRTREADGVNCLFLQMRLLGYPQTYQKFRNAIGDIHEFQDIASLAHLAEHNGVDLVPVKLKSSELLRIGYPVLVHVEPEGVNTGGFCLFLGGNDHLIELIEGSSVRRIEMERERFLRIWSGYALVPRPKSQAFPIALAIIGIVMLTYTTLIVRGSRKRRITMERSLAS